MGNRAAAASIVLGVVLGCGSSKGRAVQSRDGGAPTAGQGGAAEESAGAGGESFGGESGAKPTGGLGGAPDSGGGSGEGGEGGESDPRPPSAICRPSNVLSLYNSTGAGPIGLPGPPEVSSTSAPLFAITTDLNGDGWVDLVLGNADAATVSVLFGLGDGAMGPPADYLIGFELRSAIAADLNDDGLPDLAGVVRDGARVLMNRGDGQLEPPVAYPTVFLGASVAAADLNRDGDLDLAIGTQGGSIDVRLNLGDGTFSAPANYFVGATEPPLVLADMNGDGVPDVVSASREGNAIYVSLGLGDGTLAPPVSYPDPYELWTVAVGDLDGDGTLDLAVGEQNRLRVLLNRGDATFEDRGVYPESIPLRTNPNAVVVIDVNDDGKNDVVFQGWNEAAVFVNVGGGVFQNPLTYAVGGPNMIAADLNGDNVAELLTPSRDGVFIVPVDVHGGLTAPPHYDGERNPVAAAADFDGDGLPDLALGSLDLGLVQMFFNAGHGDFSAPGVILGSFFFPGAMRALDLNGDGWPDVVTANGEVNGLGTVGVVPSLGEGAFGAAVTYATDGSRATALGGADFDGDGLVDVVVANSVSDDVSVLLNAGAGILGSPSRYPAGALPVALAPADLDGDGAPDLAVANANGVSVLINDGTGSLGMPVRLQGPDEQADGVVALDIDGDDRIDLAASSGGGVTILMNQGDAAFSMGVTYRVGLGSHHLATLDVSGEGWPDLAVTNFTSMTVSLLVNDGRGGFHPASSYPAGQGALALTTADFNTDGRGDVAVTLNDNSLSILLSTCQ